MTENYILERYNENPNHFKCTIIQSGIVKFPECPYLDFKHQDKGDIFYLSKNVEHNIVRFYYHREDGPAVLIQSFKKNIEGKCRILKDWYISDVLKYNNHTMISIRIMYNELFSDQTEKLRISIGLLDEPKSYKKEIMNFIYFYNKDLCE